MNLFPENKVSHFTTELQFPCWLKCAYEVALVEITFDHCWDVELGNVIYEFMYESETINVQLRIIHLISMAMSGTV
jgi:hypothetical protein